MTINSRLLVLNLCCAGAYFFTASIGHQLAVPPSGASPVWPAAGVALAILLVYGQNALPGLFLGMLAGQWQAFFDSSTASAIINSLLMGIVMSIGSCLQVYCGAFLIKRNAGDDLSLIKDRDIASFLLLGGPLSCVIAATIGSLTLIISGAISVRSFFSTWLTWWIGDSIGVMIFTPLLLIFLAEPKPLWHSRKNYVLYPLLMLLALVTSIFYYTGLEEDKEIKNTFNQQVSLLNDTLQDELDHHLEINLLLKSFFDSSEYVSKDEFHQFTQTLLQQHTSLKALEWIPRVTDKDRALFESGSPQIVIRELNADQQQLGRAKQRDQYFPVTYVEPLFNNERALGFDVATNPQALAALTEAQNSMSTASSARIKLVQDSADKNFQGVVIYSPVYAKGQILQNVMQRQRALTGFVANIFRINEEIAEVLKHLPQMQILLQITNDDKIIFTNFPSLPQHKLKVLSLEQQKTVRLANQVWKISYLPSQDFINQHQSWARWWLLFGCLLFISLTGMSLLMLSGHTLRNEELVKLRTAELHKEISEHKASNRVLQAVASAVSLSEVLLSIVQAIEEDDPDLICSISLLDEEGKQLKHGAARRLPDFFNQALDGIEIGPGSGSCAMAAYLKQRVIVTDLNEHPYWVKLQPVAKRADLVACWSEPIISTDSSLLGTFAIYYRTPRTPTPEELKKISYFAQLTSLAIERKTVEQRIHYLAFYDVLTGLPNRRLLHERLKQELITANRYNGHGALMFLDLDHFKTLNDSLGHQVGDELLIQVAQRLKRCVRDEDTVARLGGDEFVVLLKTAPQSENTSQVTNYTMMVANRIQSALYIPYSLQGYEHYVTSSIGITLFGQDNKDIDDLFKQADTAMYAAKNKGRNTFSFYNEQMEHQADKRLQLERSLRAAINEQQFQLYYQGQYNAEGQIIGAEAFLRWQHPQQGHITTADYMTTCEESGLILAIGEWSLRAACSQLSNWPSLDHIAVNISPRQFHQPGFVDQIGQILTKYELSPQRLMLELTEKALLKDVAVSIEKLEALKTLGVKIAIDDFGTGYSSLAQLRNLPINQVKIDQSFIRDIANNHNSKLIVETMIMLARQLDLQIVAEGVENLEQLQFLQQKECYAYQGYYFSKLLPADEFSALLKV